MSKSISNSSDGWYTFLKNNIGLYQKHIDKVLAKGYEIEYSDNPRAEIDLIIRVCKSGERWAMQPSLMMNFQHIVKTFVLN